MIHSDILFTGFYGQFNTGDDAFVEVTSWAAKKYWHRDNNRFLAIESNLPHTINQVKGYPLTFPKTYDFQKKMLINNCDYLISAGGSTIHSSMESNNAKQIAVERKDKKRDIKIGAIGVSIGPFKTSKDEKAVQDYLKKIDFIALRDKRSYDYVKSLNTSYAPINAFDLAALMPEMYQFHKVRNIEERKTIGVSVCPYESLNKGGNLENEERRNNKIIDLIQAIDKKDNVLFKFYIINGNVSIGDKSLTLDVIKKANPKNFIIIEYNRNVQDMWKDLNRCDVIIATRLHAAIFACFGGTPFLLVEYHIKCADFLEDIGSDSNARIYDAVFDVNEKANLVLEWCHDFSSYQVPVNIKQKIEQSRLNFTNVTL